MSLQLTYTSNPTGISATINGQTVTSNSTLSFPTNSSVTISVLSVIRETTTVTVPIGSGTTTPGPGVYDKLLVPSILATPATGWQFDHWTYDGVNMGNANPFVIWGQQYKFKHFIMNGAIQTQNPLTIIMDNFKSVESVYELIDMGLVTITGSVSAQVAADQIITIVITKPGGTPVSLPNVKTDANRNFSTTYSEVAGNYTLVASIAADSQYAAASSGVISFSIALVPRTITVTVA